jgi:hypothetical protein
MLSVLARGDSPHVRLPPAHEAEVLTFAEVVKLVLRVKGWSQDELATTIGRIRTIPTPRSRRTGAPTWPIRRSTLWIWRPEFTWVTPENLAAALARSGVLPMSPALQDDGDPWRRPWSWDDPEGSCPIPRRLGWR